MAIMGSSMARNALRIRNPAVHNREPSFLAVLAGKASFCRVLPPGVFVVPVTELGA